MKRHLLKAVLFVVIALVVLVACATAYIVTFLPNTRQPEELTIERTPERVVRGKYSANNVVASWTATAGAIIRCMQRR